MTIQAQALKFVRNKNVQLLTVALVSGGASAFTAIKVAETKLEAKYAEIAREEIDQAREHYKAIRKVEEYAQTPEELAEEKGYSDEIASTEGYVTDNESPDEVIVVSDTNEVTAPDGTVIRTRVETIARVEDTKIMVTANKPDPTTLVSNIFHDAKSTNSTFDYAEELDNRKNGEPYIISEDEFIADENSWDQVSLTYFEGDDTLVDARDMPIPETERTVGDQNLTRFGHGSRDKNIVYVRNEKIETEFEISRDPGEFANEAFIRHSSDSSSLRRFREHDG